MFFIMIALQYNLKLWMVGYQTTLLLFRIVTSSGYFGFPYRLQNYPFMFCKELFWNVDRDCTQFVECLSLDDHFYYANPINPRAWVTVPFCNSFFQGLEVLDTQVFHFHLFGLSNNKIFFITYGYCKLCSFSWFLSQPVYNL